MQRGHAGLSPARAAWRLALSTAALVLVILGTAVGDDTWWPFAPISQYAFLVRDDGVINSPFMEARTTEGDLVRVPLSGTGLGLERSEMEGQLPRFIAEPSRMQAIAVLHARRSPAEPRYTEIFLRNRQTALDAARTVRIIDLASWRVANPQDPESGQP